MKTRIYLAAPWVHRETAALCALFFVEAGFEITEFWWNHRNVPQAEEHAEELACQAIKDFEGVMRAQFLVVLNLEKSEGKAVEQGIALAQGIPIIGVGTRGSNVFQYLSDYHWVPDVPAAIVAIENLVRFHDTALLY